MKDDVKYMAGEKTRYRILYLISLTRCYRSYLHHQLPYPPLASNHLLTPLLHRLQIPQFHRPHHRLNFSQSHNLPRLLQVLPDLEAPRHHLVLDARAPKLPPVHQLRQIQQQADPPAEPVRADNLLRRGLGRRAGDGDEHPRLGVEQRDALVHAVPLRVVHDVHAARRYLVPRPVCLVVDDLVVDARQILLYQRQLGCRHRRDDAACAEDVSGYLCRHGSRAAQPGGDVHRLALEAVCAHELQSAPPCLVRSHHYGCHGGGLLRGEMSRLAQQEAFLGHCILGDEARWCESEHGLIDVCPEHLVTNLKVLDPGPHGDNNAGALCANLNWISG